VVFICCSDGEYQYQNGNGILIITSKFEWVMRIQAGQQFQFENNSSFITEKSSKSSGKHLIHVTRKSINCFPQRNWRFFTFLNQVNQSFCLAWTWLSTYSYSKRLDVTFLLVTTTWKLQRQQKSHVK
jgi:hypothetical protein